MFWLIFAATWIACGVLGYGLALAYYDREWPDLMESKYDNVASAVFNGMMGPGGVIALIAVAGCQLHGLKFVPRREPVMSYSERSGMLDVSLDEYMRRMRANDWSIAR